MSLILIMGSCGIRRLKNAARLDLEKYTGHKISREEYRVTSGDTVFLLQEYITFYVETIQKERDLFLIRKFYDRKTLLLQSEGLLFLDCAVGVHKFYDEKGRLTEERHLDTNFAFTPEMLVKKLIDDFKINPYIEKNKLYISRVYNNAAGGTSRYEIRYDNGGVKFREIHIDGMTGAVLKDWMNYNMD